MTALDTPPPVSGGNPIPTLDLQDHLDETATCQQLAYDWLSWHRDSRNHAKRTVGTYADGIIKWLAYCEDNDIDPMTPSVQDMEAFITRPRPRARKGVGSPATQAVDVKMLHGFYGWCVDREHMLKNPAKLLVAPTIPRKNPKPIPDEVWQTIWGHDLPPRLRATLGLGFYGGLRREELVTITCAQLTPTRIVNFTRKGGGEDSLPWLDMANVIAAKLPALLPDVAVFESAVVHVRNHHDKLTSWSGGHQLYKRMVRLCEQVGVAPYTPHQLRHSAVTNLLRAGIPPHIVMRLMNHTSIDITMGYAKAGANELREFLDMTGGTR